MTVWEITFQVNFIENFNMLGVGGNIFDAVASRIMLRNDNYII